MLIKREDFFVAKAVSDSFICLSLVSSFFLKLSFVPPLILTLLITLLFLFLVTTLFSSSSLNSEESTLEDTSFIVSSTATK